MLQWGKFFQGDAIAWQISDRFFNFYGPSGGAAAGNAHSRGYGPALSPVADRLRYW